MNCLKCGTNISDTCEDGVNGSSYFECSDCGIGFNVFTRKLDKED